MLHRGAGGGASVRSQRSVAVRPARSSRQVAIRSGAAKWYGASWSCTTIVVARVAGFSSSVPQAAISSPRAATVHAVRRTWATLQGSSDGERTKSGQCVSTAA
jgi:hypothetical protein